MNYFTCRQNIRPAGLGFEPELTAINPADIDYKEPEALEDWLDTDQLTLIEHPHITGRGTVGGWIE